MRIHLLLAIMLLSTTVMAAEPMSDPVHAISLQNAGFEKTSKEKCSHWHFMGKGYSIDKKIFHEGSQSIYFESTDKEAILGTFQVLTFKEPFFNPIRFGAWTKTDGAKGHGDFSFYLDVEYNDGTFDYAVTVPFSRRKHDWRKSERVFYPSRPIKEIKAYLLFRRMTGNAWFDSAFLEPLPQSNLQEITDMEPYCRDRGYCVWLESSMRRVFLNTKPIIPKDKLNEKTLPVSLIQQLHMARNEYESFQIAVHSVKGLDAIRFECSDLVKVDQPSVTISQKNIDWKQVGYVKADKIRDIKSVTNKVSNIVKYKDHIWWPDPLLSVNKGTCPAGQTVSFWLTVYTPVETVPGDYEGKVRVIPEGKPATDIPIRISVRNVAIPNEPRLNSAFALMDGFLEKVYGKKITREMRQRYDEMMIRYHLMPEGDISRTETPDLELLKRFKDRGLGTFNIMNMVEPRGKNAWRCNSPQAFYTAEGKENLLKRLTPCIEELRKLGLADRAYIYTFDECNKEMHPIMTEFFSMVKEHFPEVATFTTAYIGTDLELLNKLKVDWSCPLTPRYDFEEAEKCRAAGKKIWAYICCGPNYPYANIMCRFPLIDSRILGWQAWEQKYDGILYWGVNIWDKPDNKPIDQQKSIFIDWSIESYIGHEIYGDGRLMYAGINDEPIGSIRLAGLRDGFEDYDLISILEKQSNREHVLKNVLPVFDAPTDFSRDPNVLIQQRLMILNQFK